MERKYREALTEIYEILLYIDQESFDKIPFEVIYKITENKDNTYNFEINDAETKIGEIIENKIQEETKEILAYLYLKYWNDNQDEKREEQLNALEEIMKTKGIYPIFTLDLNIQYIPDKEGEKAYNEFIKKNKNVEELLPAKVHQNIFEKIKEFIIKLFKGFKRKKEDK